MTLWQTIEAWFKKQGGISHVIAGVYLFLIAAYAAVPPFQEAVLAVYAATPHWAHQLTAAVIGVVAFYVNTRKKLMQEDAK